LWPLKSLSASEEGDDTKAEKHEWRLLGAHGTQEGQPGEVANDSPPREIERAQWEGCE
jgi:hypothetical protein